VCGFKTALINFTANQFIGSFSKWYQKAGVQGAEGNGYRKTLIRNVKATDDQNSQHQSNSYS
jgi:hypothetical protein